mmetsp:Transcript_27480/g.66731  ORF Transcript_27480/g.66731 Transcript_27480/m.66731 type:complete len:281 (+) Transcript_27480:522-1364(+)
MSQLLFPFRTSQQEITLELSKILLKFLFLSFLLLLRISQCIKESFRNILQWSILINGSTHHILHFLHHTVECLFIRLDDLTRGCIHGWMTRRLAENHIRSLTGIRQGSLLGSHSRSENIVHGISQNGTSAVGIHTLGSGQRQLQPTTVIGIHGQQRGSIITSSFVQGKALCKLLLFFQNSCLPNGVRQTILDILIDKFIVTTGSIGRKWFILTILIIEIFSSSGSHFFLSSGRFKGSSFHVGRFDHVLKEFLNIGKSINDGFSHGIITMIVMFHQSLRNG